MIQTDSNSLMWKYLATLLPEIFWTCWAGPGFSAAWTTAGPVAPSSLSVYLNSLGSSDNTSRTEERGISLLTFGDTQKLRKTLRVKRFSFIYSWKANISLSQLDSVVLLPKGHSMYEAVQHSWLPVWDALMCCRNEPPGRDSEEQKHVSCRSLPAGRREDLLLSWKEEKHTGCKKSWQKENIQIR